MKIRLEGAGTHIEVDTSDKTWIDREGHPKLVQGVGTAVEKPQGLELKVQAGVLQLLLRDASFRSRVGASGTAEFMLPPNDGDTESWVRVS